MYPKLIIDLKKFKFNVKRLYEYLKERQTSMMVVTKSFCADKKMIDYIKDIDFKYIADSRIDNFTDTQKKNVLLRLPMLSEVKEVVEKTDICLISELETIKRLDEVSREKNKIYSIILMIDLGDLREGIEAKDIDLFISEILKLKNIKLEGIGTNLTCYGGVIPTEEKLNELVRIKEKIEKNYNIDLNIISGGNSSSIYLYEENKMPKEINNLRLGEVVILGRETAYGKDFLDLYKDIFTLRCEIIELKEKDTMPTGIIGMNAFGETPVFTDLGRRKRAILAIGKQDVDYNNLTFKDKNLSFFGTSSDHLIIDVTNGDYKVGDFVDFDLEYSSILTLFTSKYVKREYRK